MKKKPITISVCLMLCMVVWGSTIAFAQSSNELDGTAWILVEVNNMPPVDGVPVTFEFGATDYSFFAGCSGEGGNYMFTGSNAIDFEPLYIADSHSELCVNEEVLAVENALFGIARSRATYEITADGQLILSAGGNTAVFTPDTTQPPVTTPTSTPRPLDELHNTGWTLIEINNVTPIQIDTIDPIGIWFNVYYGGFAGCNAYVGSMYTLDGGEITFGEMTIIDDVDFGVCENEEVLAVEGALFDLIQSQTVAYEIMTDGQLILTVGESTAIFTSHTTPPTATSTPVPEPTPADDTTIISSPTQQPCASNCLSAPPMVEGVIVELTDDSVVVDSNGTQFTFPIDQNTPIDGASLEEGVQVTVLVNWIMVDNDYLLDEVVLIWVSDAEPTSTQEPQSLETPVYVTGVVVELNDTFIVVDVVDAAQKTFAITPETAVNGALVVGSLVEVEALDNSNDTSSITLLESGGNANAPLAVGLTETAVAGTSILLIIIFSVTMSSTIGVVIVKQD